MEKLKLQFDKAAVESKKNINKLQEENTKANGMIEEIRTDLEKKQVTFSKAFVSSLHSCVTGGMPNFDEQAESDGEGVHPLQGSVEGGD